MADPTSAHIADRSTLVFEDRGRRWRPPVSDQAILEGFPEWLDHRRYRRESRLGHGGMGVVYGYRDPRLDRLVAVKSLPPEVAHDPTWRAMFEQEARALASLEHPPEAVER